MKYLLLASLLLNFDCKHEKQDLYDIYRESWGKDGSRSGTFYHDCIRLNNNEFIFVGKDLSGKTFDSTVITILKK